MQNGQPGILTAAMTHENLPNMKLRLRSLPTLAITLALSSSTLSFAADETPATGTPAVAMKDEAFIKKTAQGGMTEVQLGKLAEQKATRADVKEFGALIAFDHGKANSELMALATKKSVVFSEKLDATHAGTVDKLSKLEGGQFDRAYIDDMVKDHKMDVAEFQEAAKATHDAELKTFIEKTLPILKTHLAKIEAIAAAKSK